jgi:hypothetical protein
VYRRALHPRSMQHQRQEQGEVLFQFPIVRVNFPRY